MKRIPTSFSSRMTAGYFIGFMAWMVLIIFGLAILIAPAEVKFVIAVVSVIPISICLYGFFKCGVFYTEDEIIEKRYFETVRIKINDITYVTLAYYAGYRFIETFIALQDGSIESETIESQEEQANSSFFRSLLLLFNKPGEMRLKTVRKIVRKKTAHKFAQNLLHVIRSKGNVDAKVIIEASFSEDSKWKTGYDIAEERFWRGFTEKEHDEQK